MNILVFSWRDPKHPLAGGAEQVMHEHMKGWIESGHHITLFVAKFPGCRSEEELDGVRIMRRSNRYLGVQLAGFLYYQKKKKSIDFVVDEFHGLPFFTPLYVRCPKLAVIQETARKVWFLNPLPLPINWFVGGIGFLIEPLVFLLYKATQFMTASESAKNDVIKMGIPSKNITLVPHGVILEKLSVLPPKEKIKTITYLGVLSKDKGIEDAINCFKILSDKGNFNFLVIGKPDTKKYGNYIEDLAKPLGNKIKFWGFVSQREKFELLSKSHVLINPSVHEGWGLVNIEANSVGTPVVAYSVAGSVDSVKDGHSGILCQENTPENMAEIVIKILDNEDMYQSLQKGAVSWSKNFSWEKSRKLSLELIKSLTNSY